MYTTVMTHINKNNSKQQSLTVLFGGTKRFVMKDNAEFDRGAQ